MLDKCGARAKSTGRPCTKPAGWRTSHPSQGKCYLHGGRTPIGHGRYSKIKRTPLRQSIADFLADPDPMDLLPELALLRAFVLDLINRWDDVYGPDGTLHAWHESFKNPNLPTQPKPRQMPDFSSVSSTVDRVGAMVDRIHKQKQESSISLATLNRVLEQVGADLVLAIQETGIDADSSTQLLEAVERRWNSIRLEPERAATTSAK